MYANNAKIPDVREICSPEKMQVAKNNHFEYRCQQRVISLLGDIILNIET